MQKFTYVANSHSVGEFRFLWVRIRATNRMLRILHFVVVVKVSQRWTSLANFLVLHLPP